jgi:hypothetical protein
MQRIIPAVVVASVLAAAIGVSGQQDAASKYPATVEGAKQFLADANAELLELVNAASRAGWTQSTYITVDTEIMAAQANEALVRAQTRRKPCGSTRCSSRRRSGVSSSCSRRP